MAPETEKNLSLEIPSGSYTMIKMAIQRHIHKLAFIAAAALVVFASSARAEPEPAENEKLLFSPNLLGSGSNTLERFSTNPSSTWGNLPKLARYPDSYWSTPGIDLSADVGSGKQSNKFRYVPPSGASVNTFDQFKLGDSYLGIETKRRLQTHVPSGKVDCSTDEECEDYSVMPRSRSRGSAGPRSSNILSRKPFLGLSVTTPIQ
jgi:hypothetical protein